MRPRFYNVSGVRHGKTLLATASAVELSDARIVVRVEPGQRAIIATIHGSGAFIPHGDATALGFPGIAAGYIPWQALHLPGVETIIAAGLIVAGIPRPLPAPIPLPAPFPLYASADGRQLAGLAVPLDLWGWYNGQPLAQVQIVPALDPQTGVAHTGEPFYNAENCFTDPRTGVTVAAMTDDEMDPADDEPGLTADEYSRRIAL